MFSNIDKQDRQTWFAWALLTGAGSMAGVTLVSLALNAVPILGTAEQGDGNELTLSLVVSSLVVYAILGGMIGAGQWYELRNLLPRAGLWILATAGGWLLGFSLGVLAFTLLPELPPLVLISLPFLLVGIISGVSQWLYLRRFWSDSLSWIPVSALVTVIGGLSWMITGVIGGSIGWAIAGAISGYMLLRIRDRSRLAEQPQNKPSSARFPYRDK